VKSEVEDLIVLGLLRDRYVASTAHDLLLGYSMSII
jgi:hypothetical protein